MGVITGRLPELKQTAEPKPAIVVAQASGRIVHINDAGLELLDKFPGEIIGQDFRDLFPIEFPPLSLSVSGNEPRPGSQGQWINHADTCVRGSESSFELSWRAVQLGWVGYWIVNFRESIRNREDPLIENLLDGHVNTPLPVITMPSSYKNSRNNWQLMSFHRPVKKKGGNVLFIEEINPDYLLYFLGDVAGHNNGVQIVRLMLTSYLRIYRDEFNITKASEFPGSLLSKMNDALCQDEYNDALLTGVAILLEKSGSRAWFASAGHHPGFLVRKDKSRETLTTDDIPLGIRPGIKYKSIGVEFGPDDRLLCYTEGLLTSGPELSISTGLNTLLSTLENADDTAPENLAGRLQKLWMKMERETVSNDNDVTFSVIFNENHSCNNAFN
jgi:hypothetical protein